MANANASGTIKSLYEELVTVLLYKRYRKALQHQNRDQFLTERSLGKHARE